MVLTAICCSRRRQRCWRMMALPLLIGGVCIVTSIIGTYLRPPRRQPDRSWARCTRASSSPACSRSRRSGGAISYCAGRHRTPRSARRDLHRPASCSTARCVGLVITGLIIWITEYYTGTNYRPVQSIAKASETGHGTNVIQGLAISHGIDRAADAGDLRRHHHRLQARRPVSASPCGHRDAGAGRHGRRARRLRPGHRQRRRHRRDGRPAQGGPRKTDALDAVGNTTKAVTKGYAIGSAGLAALVLFAAYTTDLQSSSANLAASVLPGRARLPLRTPTSSSGCCSARCCRTCSARWA